jgi:hypothetical protein
MQLHAGSPEIQIKTTPESLSVFEFYHPPLMFQGTTRRGLAGNSWPSLSSGIGAAAERGTFVLMQANGTDS